MRFSLLVFFLLSGAISALGQDVSQARDLVSQIRNSDVDFQGEYPGIVEHIGGASEEVRKVGLPAVPFLYDALLDRNRYIAAHVLLTHLVLKSWSCSSTHWNHLAIDTLGPVTERSVKDQRDIIREFWMKLRAAKEEPNSPTTSARM